MELRTRRSSSSPYTDSPAHSRHGGSPLHYYVPGNTPTQAKTHTRTHREKKYLDRKSLCGCNSHLHAHVIHRVICQCIFQYPVCLTVCGCGSLMLWFLSLWLAGLSAGSESGRSSPYYSQPEPKCATPTNTFQAPKHFHVPGRPLLCM